MQRLFPYFLFVCSLVLAFLSYSAGLSGGFMFDDIINIVENPHLKIQTLEYSALKSAAFSTSNNIAGRPISMLSFALDYYAGASAPYDFKLTNLFIHLLNGMAVFAFTMLLLDIGRKQHAIEIDSERSRWICLAVASAWLLHPLNLTSVLYVVQRMTSLSALFVLLGLISYLLGRRRQLNGKNGWAWILAAFFLFTPLAVLSKENGALLPAFMLLVEFILLNFAAPQARTRVLLKAWFAVMVVLPAIALAVYFVYKPAWLLAGYTIRDFTLPERLMTEGRVLWFYLQLIIVPDISQFGLQHDDIVISKGILTPYTTLFAGIGIAMLIGFALMFRKRHPVAALGILFFMLGHSIESSVIALEISHEHRNYLPSFGIILVIFYYLLQPSDDNQASKLRWGAAVLLVMIFAAVTLIRAGQWGDSFGMAQLEVKHHPESLRANTQMAYIYASLPAYTSDQAETNYQLALKHYRKASELSATDTLGLLGLMGLNAGFGRPIESQWVRELEYRLEHYPFIPNAANSLMALEKCLTSGACKHSPQDMKRLLQAALRNSSMRARARRVVQFSLSNLLFVSFHDRAAARQAAKQALEATPDDPSTRITYIIFMIDQGWYDQAREQIDLMRQAEVAHFHDRQLDELEKLVTIQNPSSHK